MKPTYLSQSGYPHVGAIFENRRKECEDIIAMANKEIARNRSQIKQCQTAIEEQETVIAQKREQVEEIKRAEAELGPGT